MTDMPRNALMPRPDDPPRDVEEDWFGRVVDPRLYAWRQLPPGLMLPDPPNAGAAGRAIAPDELFRMQDRSIDLTPAEAWRRQLEFLRQPGYPDIPDAGRWATRNDIDAHTMLRRMPMR